MTPGVTISTVVYLYVRIITAGNGNEDSRTAYASMTACRQAASSARIVTGSGGDSENIAVIWCGGSRERPDGLGNWHRQQVTK